MFVRLFTVISIVLLICTACQPIPASDRETRVDVYKSWSVFTKLNSNPKLCWVASTALSGTATPKKTYLLYSLKKREISVVFEGPDTPATTGVMKIADQELPMFFRGNKGWMKTARLDAVAANTMRNTPRLQIRAGDMALTFVTDGFDRAARRAGELCGTSPFLPPA